MIYNATSENEANIATNQFYYLIEAKKTFELKEVRGTRTNLQNKSLHLFFTLIADELNNLGLEFMYTGIKGLEMSSTYTSKIVKDFIWKPIQKTLFDINSTTKLNTIQINEISDILIKFFGEKGIYIVFPSTQGLLDKNSLNE